MLWMGPKECVWSIGCLAKFEERLAVLNAFLCSRNLWQSSGRFVSHTPFHSQGTSTYKLLIVNIYLLFVVCVLVDLYSVVGAERNIYVGFPE